MAKKKGKQKSSNAVVASTPAEGMSSIHTEAFEAALNSAAPPVLIKLCRLCESKDGPFLNIFGTEQGIAKKIDTLLPFTISQYDDLPHKICFRCSAKVEELHDFVQKCVTAQGNLQKVLGKKTTLVTKTKTRKIWEAKLNMTNMSNDDICKAVIEKAMAGIKELPNPIIPPSDNIVTMKRKSLRSDKNAEVSDYSDAEIPVKKSKLSNEKKDEEIVKPLRPTRSTVMEAPLEAIELPKTNSKKPNIIDSNESNSPKNVMSKPANKYKAKDIKKQFQEKPPASEVVEIVPTVVKEEIVVDDSSDDESDDKVQENVPQKETTPKLVEAEKPPFDIMSHVCTIRVNGVGVLFQCKLCNRNFLSKEVVMTHGCAKTGVPKPDFPPTIAQEQPKPPVNNVKYITNDDIHKSQHAINSAVAPVKTKPKIGPASKVKKQPDEVPSVGMRVTPMEVTPTMSAITTFPPSISTAHVFSLPAIEVPPIPGMKNRYRLVPGPNNSFSLIEDPHISQPEIEPPPQPQPRLEPSIKVTKVRKIGPKSKVRKQSDEDYVENHVVSNILPYPVGLFQAVTPGGSSVPPPPHTAPVTFTTPAMKKHNYTVVQTGNPSKLLISTKPRTSQDVIEPPKPKSKRKKKDAPQIVPEEPKQPYNLTIEDVAPPKDPGFFTFINVDPLLQPSYVLPTHNIIQESQITTSSAIAGSSKEGKDSYDCSLCPEKFSREKKMLAHLQAHYNKIDQEDKTIAIKNTRKKSRKS